MGRSRNLILSLRMRRAGRRSCYSRRHLRFLRREFLDNRLRCLRYLMIIGELCGLSWAMAVLVLAMEQQEYPYLNPHPHSFSPLAASSS